MKERVRPFGRFWVLIALLAFLFASSSVFALDPNLEPWLKKTYGEAWFKKYGEKWMASAENVKSWEKWYYGPAGPGAGTTPPSPDGGGTPPPDGGGGAPPPGGGGGGGTPIPGGGLPGFVGADGLLSLKNGTIELLNDGKFKVITAEFQKPDGTIVVGSTTGTVTKSGDTVTRTYDWGSVSMTYLTLSDRTEFYVSVKNASANKLVNFLLQIVVVKFPSVPVGWDGVNPHLGHNFGWPTIIPAHYGTGQLVFCNKDVAQPLLSGYWKASDSPANKTYQVLVSTGPILGWGALLDPVLNREIPSGGSDWYTVSLNHAGAGATGKELAPGIYDDFAKAFPMKLSWPDRRPIGACFLSSSALGFAGNPRGWLNDSSLDVKTSAGKALLDSKLMSYADVAIANCKAICAPCGGAQGVIVWDIEGQEFPHNISYLGDPRSLPPEMEPIADKFFKKFLDAGLKTGLCIRPQMPVRRPYTEGVFQIEVLDPVENMSSKIAEAKKRWGCTMFYVDSNGDPNVPTDPLVFKKLLEKHPDVLLIPEHETPAYWAYSAPYGEADMDFFGTPQSVRDSYPGAFSVIYGPDGPLVTQKAKFVDAVKKGDIMMFRCWYADPETAKIEAILTDAKK